MRSLLDERFAPITSSMGFLEASIEEAADGLERWRKYLYRQVDVSRLDTGFPDALCSLEPLVGGAVPRELLVSAGRWTAYFDCSLRGTDAMAPISYLCLQMQCRGLAIDATPHTVGLKGVRGGRMGAVKFELFGPERTDWLNYIRSVAVVYDGNRWVFQTQGAVQDFEETDAYRARRVRDRFTSEMLEQYCQALGLDVFNPDTYGPAAMRFESSVVMPPSPVIKTLAETQEWLEIRPGTAAELPG